MTKPGWQVRRIRWCSVFWCSFWFWEGARGPSNQRNSLLLNRSPQFGEVVHLAVVGDEHRPLFVGHWYAAAGGKIRYGEPSTAEADVGTVGTSRNRPVRGEPGRGSCRSTLPCSHNSL